MKAERAKWSRHQLSRELAIVVRGIGMSTKLGNARTACAAARAGIVRHGEIWGHLVHDPSEGDMVPLIGSAVAPGFAGVARLAVLAARALDDLLLNARVPADSIGRMGLVLALGSGYHLDAAHAVEGGDDVGAAWPAGAAESHAWQALLRGSLVSRLLELAAVGATPAAVELIFEDHAGGALALRLGCELIAGGMVDHVIVGGVDSYCDEAQLEALSLLDLLKTPDIPVGLIPGEGAAMLLLERATKSSPFPATLVDSIAFEPGEHALSPAARGSRALEHALHGLCELSPAAAAARLSIGTHNGTIASAIEWGNTSVRYPRLSDGQQWFPAGSFGDTGAASQLIAMSLAARAFERRYAYSDAAVIWASGPCGARSAACLVHPTEKEMPWPQPMQRS